MDYITLDDSIDPNGRSQYHEESVFFLNSFPQMRSFLDESRILRNYAINRKIHRDVSVRCRAVQVIQIGRNFLLSNTI